MKSPVQIPARVYPRVGGGTADVWATRPSAMGLSPRGRGNPGVVRLGEAGHGSIPAWAGEPTGCHSRACIAGVYPRVGGGTDRRQCYRLSVAGLSPRGRGNRLHPGNARQWRGSIPAWAGEPFDDPNDPQSPTVYPRVGGGTANPSADKGLMSGLSPRGRGNPHPAAKKESVAGSIPAWAGEPGRRRPLPRILEGLSPRGRGNPVAIGYGNIPGRSIPAWAGEPDPRSPVSTWCTVYPRVGGGTTVTGAGNCAGAGLSPRGRGNHEHSIYPREPLRSIPAWAGEPWPYGISRPEKWVYPRVGGGTLNLFQCFTVGSGLSPRGRGNPFGVGKASSVRGSIPAWAGEPRRQISQH